MARRSGVAVPTSAVTRSDDGDFVQVVTDGRIELRKIKVGVTNSRLSEAREGLSAGESVVTRNHVQPGGAAQHGRFVLQKRRYRAPRGAYQRP